MSKMNMPGFTAEATLRYDGGQYQCVARFSGEDGVIPQSKATCAFKAGRLAGRCLALGYDRYDCYALAADFNEFCNQNDL